MLYRCTPWLCGLTVLAGCASQTHLTPSVRARVSTEHHGRVVESRQSSYWGDFYDENELWLLSPYPFADLHDLEDLNGAPIRPKRQRGILPAGTRFEITRVEFPDLRAMSQRMLTTPRYHPWVYLRLAGETDARLLARPAFVMLLPRSMRTYDEVEAAIDERFAPEGTMGPWMNQRRPSIAAAIRHKEVVHGMSTVELIAAFGAPRAWLDEGTSTVAWYPSNEVVLVGGAVTTVRPARRPTSR